MNETENPIARQERIAARASALHDAAFADAKIEKKPSWAQSLAAAEKEDAEKGGRGDGEKPSAKPARKP